MMTQKATTPGRDSAKGSPPGPARAALFVPVLLALIAGGCSLDPIGELFESSTGPFTDQVGPYLRITHNPGPDWYPAWSGDGTMIAYSAWGFEDLTQSQITVNVIPSAGGVSTRVSPVFSRTDYDLFPCWLDNDAGVTYITFGGINFTAPLAPTVTTVALDDPRQGVEYAPGLNGPLDFEISPDGRTLAYSDYLTTVVYTGESSFFTGDDYALVPREVPSGSVTFIWTAAFPPSGEARRVEGTKGASDLSWSPDSDLLAFSKDGAIYTISPEGGSAERLFEGRSPAWSPDGTRIACVIDGNIFVRDLTGGGSLPVTTEGGIQPAWSPDGEKIAFSWDRNGNYDIYVVDLDDLTGTN